MALKDFFQFFVPKDKTFFPIFEKTSLKLNLLSETLHEAVNIKGDREELYKKILINTENDNKKNFIEENKKIDVNLNKYKTSLLKLEQICSRKSRKKKSSY